MKWTQVFTRRIQPGYDTPWWLGAAWYDYRRFEGVYVIIPLNVPVAIVRWILRYLRHPLFFLRAPEIVRLRSENDRVWKTNTRLETRNRELAVKLLDIASKQEKHHEQSD